MKLNQKKKCQMKNSKSESFLERMQKYQYKQKTNITYEKIYEESILCHHNSIADYIKDNFLDQNQTTSFERMIIYSCNYFYFPADLESIGKNEHNIPL